MAPGLVIGSLVGAGIADLLSGPHLQLIIGSFAIWVAFKMFKGAHTVVDQTQSLPSRAMQILAGEASVWLPLFSELAVVA